MNFHDDALREMADITAQGKIPLLVGGTMLYYKALIEGLSPSICWWKVTAEIEEKRKNLAGQRFTKITKIDPISAERINPNDSQRINRALEVFYLTGKSLTKLTEQKGEELPYQFLQFAITGRACGVTSTYRTTFP